MAPANTNTSTPNGLVGRASSTVSLPQTSSQLVTPATPIATPIRRVEDTKPVTTVTPSPVTTVHTSAAVTTAPPSDWRKSWGKIEESKPPITEKPAQISVDSKPAPAIPLLPQADSKRPDPLQMPAQYDRRPVDEKPSAQKSDTMVVPATAAAATTTVKPAVATVVQPAKASPPISSMPVPLGAQSVIQAGDAGPGGVRYIPVPMVTIPDVRRAPVPPMTSPAQVYGTSGAMPATSAGTQGNAFTPVLPRQTYAQATNAFSTGVQIVPPAASGPPMPVNGSTGMIAQGLRPAGGNNPTSASVMPAGFQGATPANQNMPVAYQSTLSPASPPFPSRAAVKPMPENIRQMTTSLRDSLYPSQRECAAENMTAVDWRTHPEVVQALTTAAKDDPAATVRMGCIRCLAKMKVNTLPVISTVRDMKNDIDPRVRREAEQALATLDAGAR